MRANGKVTPDMWWDFKYTLAEIIASGIEGLLYDGVTDWDNPIHKKEKQDLEFILGWAQDFPLYEAGIMAKDDEDYVLLTKHSDGAYFIYTEEEGKKFEKRTEKAFKLLAKNYHTLWD